MTDYRQSTAMNSEQIKLVKRLSYEGPTGVTEAFQ